MFLNRRREEMKRKISWKNTISKMIEMDHQIMNLKQRIKEY